MTEYSFHVCPVCGVHYAVDRIVMDYKRSLPSSDKDRGWHCPNGHSLVFTETPADRFRQERDRARQQLARLEDEKREAEERARKAEAATARIKKRTAAGVCPCCTRSFTNLRRHMASKHPDVVPLKTKARA